MSLSGNTEKINELLSKINALPEAGSGGSAQVATGSVIPTATSLYNDPVVVDGIGFEPKTVIFIIKGTNTVTTNNQEYVVCRIAGELGDYAVSGTKISFGCQFKGDSASYYPITLSADGFTLNSIDSTHYIFKSIYEWIAIG